MSSSQGALKLVTHLMHVKSFNSVQSSAQTRQDQGITNRVITETRTYSTRS